MAVFSRGFGARRRESDPRLPPGQYLTEDFPVLSAGPTPRIDTAEWTFDIRSESGAITSRGRGTSSWRCRSRTSRPTSTASRAGRSSARRGEACRSTRCSSTSRPTPTTSMAHSYGGYTTNVPMEDLRGRQGLGGVRVRRRAARSRARRPGAAARAAPVLLEERQVGARPHADGRRRARVLGAERLQHARRPLDRRALLVIVGDWRRGARRRRVGRDADARELLRSTVPGWPGSDPGQHVDVRLTAEDGYQAERSYSLGSYGAGEHDRARRRRDPRGRGVAVPRPRRAARRRARGERVRSAATSSGGPGERSPVQLIAGGSGIVPLMAMARASDGCRGPASVPAAVLGAHAAKTRYIAMSSRRRGRAGGVDGHLGVHARRARRLGGHGRPARRRVHRAAVWPPDADAGRLRLRADGVRRARRRHARRARA